MPSFKSKAVEKGHAFNANIHIEKPVVFLQPSKKYFTLTDVSYEQTTVKPKAKKPKTKPKTNGGSTTPPENEHVGA